MGRLYYSAEELLKRPIFPGMHDPTHLYYHFRPARPANLLLTTDPVSGELNLSGGTYGPLTDTPYTICLHSSKHSFDATRNTQLVGIECVVALPGRNLVTETWFSALPLPRGIFEGEVAELTMIPSQVVKMPSIAECAVNLECRIEFIKDWYSHWALFLRVVAASIDEDLLEQDRLTIIRQYPTYEVDDQTNQFGGSIERLGVNGELLDCPGFPVGARRGADASVEEWLADLNAAGHLSSAECSTLNHWFAAQATASNPNHAAPQLTRAVELLVWEEWDALHDLLASAPARAAI